MNILGSRVSEAYKIKFNLLKGDPVKCYQFLETSFANESLSAAEIDVTFVTLMGEEMAKEDHFSTF